jgi:hypothetical protein
VSPAKARKVDHALVKKGFAPGEGNHHFYFLVVDGKTTGIFTKISHGHDEISDKNLGRMARQMKISRREFDSFIDCKLTVDDYISQLRKEGKL